MKHFLKTILFFFLPLTIILIGLEYGMRSVPNVYQYKNQWLEKNISTTKIWVIGASHGLYGINPEYFSKPAFNSCHVSQTLPYDAFIFDKFIDKADSLESVILPVSYFSLTYSLEQSDEWWRIKNYCIYYDCPYHSNETKYHLEILGNPLPYYKQVIRVWHYWKDGMDSRGCDSLGFAHDYSKDKRSEEWWKGGDKRANSHTKNIEERKDVIRTNIDYLEKILISCEKKNIRVMLLTTPVCSSYYENIDDAQYELMVNTCEDMTKRHCNVIYVNLLTDSRFTVEDFYDADHLCEIGAEKLTRIIDDLYITK